jgi:hypothetical protein
LLTCGHLILRCENFDNVDVENSVAETSEKRA